MKQKQTERKLHKLKVVRVGLEELHCATRIEQLKKRSLILSIDFLLYIGRSVFFEVAFKKIMKAVVKFILDKSDLDDWFAL